ncbi:helix-turn-helix transcriptional regulator [Cupriavidus gilardii]|uniref:helix-turn-helix domain-containing protein n=1 Tax=Cupriavidus gilardii TaxID=82541 RepID=UPI001ABE7602|nr:helix-turn-helix transcriptional regulator [Cupriavidus gilardii]MBO4120258.1 helix-turn-helix transcriptional regulator [Cupriavidus gilardii]
MDTFTDRLRWAMAQMDPPISQRRLALRIGVRPQAIQYLCNPSNNAKGSRHTHAIAHALGVDATWLAKGTGAPRRRVRRVVDQRHAIWECIRCTHILLTHLERVAASFDE